MSANSTGRKHSEKTKKRMSRMKRQWWKSRTPEQIAETKKRIGQSSKGRIGCRREKSPMWKGGRSVSKRDGYVYITVPEGTLGARKANGKGTTWRILEHRYVMQKHIGRALRVDENVHHRNGNKADNRIKNLMLVPHRQHFEKFICPHCGGEFFHQ